MATAGEHVRKTEASSSRHYRKTTGSPGTVSTLSTVTTLGSSSRKSDPTTTSAESIQQVKHVELLRTTRLNSSCGDDLNEAVLTCDAMELSAKAKLAHDWLRQKTGSRGKIDPGEDKSAPKSYDGILFELKYDRPAHAVIISRDFFPISGTYDAIRMSALMHAKSTSPSSIEEMHAFILEVRRRVKAKIRADVAVQHSHDIR